MSSEGEQLDLRVVDASSDVVEILLAGEVDIATISAVRSALMDHSNRSIMADLTDVTFVDSSAIGLFVTESQRFQEQGKSLRLRKPQPSVRKVMEIIGVTSLLEGDTTA